MFDDWQSVLWVVGSILGAYGVVLWLGIIVWTYRDMRERTHDGWSQTVAVLLVGIFNVAGLFLYLLLRPHETLAEAYERRLEAELLVRDTPERRQACPRCERPANEDFLVCPYCRATLREPCLGCGRALELNWTACPYCGAEGPRTAVPPAPPAAAEPPAPAAAEPAAPSASDRPARSATTGTRRARTGGRSS
jgi:RNA polymerase subunit RPABC4/transcription elongation factor Spt4